MTTRSDAVPEPAAEAQAAAPSGAPTRPLLWSIRRELWENRSIYVGPLVAAAVVVLGFTLHTAIRLPARIASLPSLDPARQEAAVILPYSVAASMIIIAAYLVGAFYCLDALHSERRDRSILFWKSLPVSDLTAVLSKISIPLLVLPAIAFVLSLAAQLAILSISTVVLAASGVGPGAVWSRLPLLSMTLVMLYGLVVFALWHAPLYAWLLLISAWARRLPLLWAVLPPLALGAFERIVFQTSHFGSLIHYRVGGAMKEAFVLAEKQQQDPIHVDQLDPLGLLASPGLWTGLAAAALFLFVVVRLRRRAEPL